MNASRRSRAVIGTMLGMVSLMAACSRTAVYEGRSEAVPAIAAQGWLNGPQPAAEELLGKVTVLEVWAHW